MKKIKEYKEFLLESAPKLPKDVNYWLKQGKTGKDVCIFTHDDLDGVVSAIIMKNYLIHQGFKIKKYGIINYQESWEAFNLDPKLINIALDFAEDISGVDIYIDHHGVFTEDEWSNQLKHSIKTSTGSAAEGIAQQLGQPFSNDIKNWIDMIDSAKYTEYDIDIRGILNFDLKDIAKSENSKLKFAAAMNQLLKRSDHRTFIEVINSCQEPSIYNIYRLFKIFYPKNNPDFRTGKEPDFVEDAKKRLGEMQRRTKGDGTPDTQGYDSEGKKIRFESQKDFWEMFAKKLPYKEIDENGDVIYKDPKDISNLKWQVKPGVYQLIGNLMYVPSGTWANALRAKAIFNQDVDKGIVPDDPKLNFVLLQYGNTLQFADLRERIQNMDENDLPKDIKGNPISNLGEYAENLVENFRTYLGFPKKEDDDRVKAGGHPGIGSISNIFGKCKLKQYEGVKYLDMFKNKIINDISGVKWSLTMPWNEEEGVPVVKPEDINKKLMDLQNIRSEEDALIEKNEREICNYLIVNKLGDFKQRRKYAENFKDPTIKLIYEIWLETHFDEIVNGQIRPIEIDQLYFKNNKKIEESEIFNKIVNKLGLTQIYNKDAIDARGKQRKELKRIFRIMFNMMSDDDNYIKKNTPNKIETWMKK